MLIVVKKDGKSLVATVLITPNLTQKTMLNLVAGNAITNFTQKNKRKKYTNTQPMENWSMYGNQQWNVVEMVFIKETSYLAAMVKKVLKHTKATGGVIPHCSLFPGRT